MIYSYMANYSFIATYFIIYYHFPRHINYVRKYFITALSNDLLQ